jgi:DNA mismatch repair protein MutL
MTLRLLDERTIGKIAAGEVVERPVSVVKELVENALDAGAGRIRIAVRGGGIELIEVFDDGCGIAPADLPLAVQRHATSKLAAFEDLDRLTTLGFRGEALPSIGAVSALAVRSRTPDAAYASLLKVTFGEVAPPVAVGAARGTAVTVRDLFANVPARRKFLRQPATEMAYIQRAAAAYAAVYPGVAFELTVDGRRAFGSDGSGDAIAAATAAWGSDVGRAAISLAPLDDSVPGVSVDGWVSAPELSRSHRQGIVIFVNGRWVQNRALGFALEEAYHSLLLVGRHPLAAVHLRLDPAAVDVNVHPTKAEVKFVDERAACRALQRAVHAALARRAHDALPDLRFTPVPQTLPARQRPMPFAPPRFGALRTEQLAPRDDLNGGRAAAVHPSGVPMLRVLGQIASSYIIAEGPDGMYLIDQHAAHERVLYERILDQMRDRAVDRQQLLDPLVVDLAPDEMAAFERSAAELDMIGFEIERWDGGAIAVRAIPALIAGVDVAQRLRLVLRELAEGGQGESWLDAVAVSTACHTAIRAGQPLSLPEMRELVSALERSSQPRACGHGRPTMLHLSGSDLEKQFQRR